MVLCGTWSETSVAPSQLTQFWQIPRHRTLSYSLCTPFFVTTNPRGWKCKYAKAPSTKKTLSDFLPIDMLLPAVSFLVVAQSSSEFPEGLTNNPVYMYIYTYIFIFMHKRCNLRSVQNTLDQCFSIGGAQKYFELLTTHQILFTNYRIHSSSQITSACTTFRLDKCRWEYKDYRQCSWYSVVKPSVASIPQEYPTTEHLCSQTRFQALN